MSHWLPDWHPLEKAPLIGLVWLNWDDDDDGKSVYTWWSYVVYPVGDR